MDYKFLAESVVGGIVVTGITFLYNGIPSGLVGANGWYGFPMPWINYLVVGPQYSPWAVQPVGLIVDIIVWAIVVGIVLMLYKKYKK